MADETETRERRQPKADDARLVIFTANAVETRPLPIGRPVIIGRAEDADIHVDDPSVSRRHAAIRVGSEPLKIELTDLGSRNGTRAGKRSVAPETPVSIEPGEFVELGSIYVVVQHPGGVEGPALDPASFRRALAKHRECALLFVRAGAPRAGETLVSFLSGGDALTSISETEWMVLLPGADLDQARLAASGFRFALDRLGGRTRIGIAVAPDDGDELEDTARARCALGGADDGGRDRSVVVEDADMQKLYRLVERIAASELSVLILGETGAGKEIVAETIHARSKRSGGPFLALNCAAFAETMLESELFGHEKGAFTGAVAAKQGLLEKANGGTVFLDELGEMPMSTQTKLLRVVEQRVIRRLGSVEDRRIDVRFISATNRDLVREVEQQRFRSDLFYRLNGFALTIPPLRARRDDIPSLAAMFALAAHRREGRAGEPRIDDRAMSLLCAYRWPGNVRELKNVMERAVVLADGDRITEEHLPPELAGAAVPVAPADLGSELESFERERILAALAECGGNQTKAAAKLGLSRKALIQRLDRYDIDRPRKGKG